jgi:uncharacterized glyoxalase superfamily protein PhnB
MNFGSVVPILRILDEDKAREFYVGFLGFTVDWEHRFEAGTPLYIQISKGTCVIHLSEHFGDGTPGAAVRIDVDDVDAFQRELIGKKYKYARPGVQDQPWGMREMSVKDPFGNRLTFATPTRHA